MTTVSKNTYAAIYSTVLDNTKFCKKDDIDELKIKIRTLKGELKSEMKKESKDVSEIDFLKYTFD